MTTTTTTTISAARLVELRACGKSAASRAAGRFIDARVLADCSEVLSRRGEIWAAAVLGRSLSRRSIAASALPYLTADEEYTLVAADREENSHVDNGVRDLQDGEVLAIDESTDDEVDDEKLSELLVRISESGAEALKNRYRRSALAGDLISVQGDARAALEMLGSDGE
jgi:hypothetical protein